MADAIPVSDPGLLAAQAKAGQAGVDAYNAAISALQTQKQSAVQTALQEAAMRGSPAGAAQSQSGIIAGPYDQRIASLTQGLGSFQADQAARNTRMNDYNQAVLGARSYIPQVTEQIVAPIRAQADFQVRNTEMEGQQRVAGINADTELTLARMRANLQAAQIAAAKKAAEDAAKAAKAAKLPTLNQGELSSLMSSRAAEQVQSSGNQIRQILSANEAETLNRANTSIQAASKPSDATVNQNYWDLMGARYAGRAAQEEAAKPKTPIQNIFTTAAGNAARPPLPMQVPERPPSVTTAGFPGLGDIQGGAAQLFPVPGVTPPPIAATPARGANAAAALAAWNALNRNAAQMRTGGSAAQMISQLSQGVTQRTNQDVGLGRLRAGLGSLDTSNREFAAIDRTTGRRVFATPAQVQGLDPFTREMLMGATQVQGINSSEDFENIVMGTPSPYRDPANPLTHRYPNNQGVGNPYSSDVMRNALAEAGGAIQAQGQYDIGLPDIANAMPAKVPSIYNMLAGQSDQPTSEEAYKGMVADVAAQAKAEAANVKAGTKQEEADADQGLLNNYRRLPPNELGTSVQVLTTIVDNKAAIDQGSEILKQIIADWDTTRGGLTASQATTQLLQKGVSPALIPYIIYTGGL